MIQGTESRQQLQLLLWVVVVTATGLAGCRDTEEDRWREHESDLAMKLLESRLESEESGPGASERAKAARLKLQNRVLDEEPILIFVLLLLPDSNQPTLLSTCLDEDEDLRGLRITEEHMDSNGTKVVLEEDYPVYVAWARTPILDTAAFSVDLRGDGQRKNERLWTEYMVGGLDDVVRKAVDVRPADYMALKRRPDEATGKAVPPICVSIPEPNRVRVLVSAYDRAGNESESIELYVAPWELRSLKKVAERNQQAR